MKRNKLQREIITFYVLRFRLIIAITEMKYTLIIYTLIIYTLIIYTLNGDVYHLEMSSRRITLSPQQSPAKFLNTSGVAGQIVA